MNVVVALSRTQRAIAQMSARRTNATKVGPIRTVRMLYPFLDNFTENANTALTITNNTNTTTTPGSGTCAINF
jgi:hypothetical protein